MMGTDLWLGLATGVAFGFLLQKGRVLRFEKQVGAMLLQDMTILKFMLSAIVVGMVGITLLAGADMIALSHKPMNVGAVVLGGALFGGGWAIMGFCPGTSVGALGEGRWHALFAELYPLLESTVLAWADFGKLGWPEVLDVSSWVIIPPFAVAVLGLFVLFERAGI